MPAGDVPGRGKKGLGFGAKETGGADQVLDILSRLNRELGKTIVMVTHDVLAAEHAERIVKLDKGRLVDDTSTAERSVDAHRK